MSNRDPCHCGGTGSIRQRRVVSTALCRVHRPGTSNPRRLVESTPLGRIRTGSIRSPWRRIIAAGRHARSGTAALPANRTRLALRGPDLRRGVARTDSRIPDGWPTPPLRVIRQSASRTRLRGTLPPTYCTRPPVPSCGQRISRTHRPPLTGRRSRTPSGRTASGSRRPGNRGSRPCWTGESRPACRAPRPAPPPASRLATSRACARA